MASKNKKEEKEVKEYKAPVKPRIPTKRYVLVKDVSIGGEVFKKGSSIALTEKGKQYFKQQNFIK